MYSFMRVRKGRQWGMVLLPNVNNICINGVLKASEIEQSAFRPERMLGNRLLL